MQNFAGFAGFGDSRVGFRLRVRTGLLSAVEVQQNHVVTGGRIARYRSAAAVLGISRMPTGDHDFQLPHLSHEGRQHRRGAEQSPSGESHFDASI
jgi:hypothetical protein